MKKEKRSYLAQGYHEIGMDHFALENDAMYQSFQQALCIAILWATPHQKPK